MKEYKIDEELKALMPELSEAEKESMRESFKKYEFMATNPIVVWNDTIVDGHNRYELCKEMNIEPVVQEMSFENKEEVIEWMMHTQFARRNMNPAQKIQVISKRYRPIFEEEAKKNQGRRTDIENQNLEQTVASSDKGGKVRERLAMLAGTSAETVRKCETVLNSGDEQLIKDMLSGEKTISAAYKKIRSKKSVEVAKSVSSDNDAQDIGPTFVQSEASEEEVVQLPVSNDDECEEPEDIRPTFVSSEQKPADRRENDASAHELQRLKESGRDIHLPEQEEIPEPAADTPAVPAPDGLAAHLEYMKSIVSDCHQKMRTEVTWLRSRNIWTGSRMYPYENKEVFSKISDWMCSFDRIHKQIMDMEPFQLYPEKDIFICTKEEDE